MGPDDYVKDYVDINFMDVFNLEELRDWLFSHANDVLNLHIYAENTPDMYVVKCKIPDEGFGDSMKTFNYIILYDRKQAENIIEDAKKLCELNGFITIADLYNLGNVSYTPTSAYSNQGWTSVNDFKVIEASGRGYTIETPDPKELGRVHEYDNVNHPSHYMSYTGLETIDVIEAFTSDLTGMDAVCTANVIKYICRWKHKNGIEDLEKAQWYLNRLIEDNKPIERKSN